MSLRDPRLAPTNPLFLLRVMSGLFFIPHILHKVTGFPGVVGFFAKVGFPAPELFVVLAGATETLAAIGLIFGVLTFWAGLLGSGVLLVAAAAIWVAKGPGWVWNQGGPEYCVFWAATCLIVAVAYWRAGAMKGALELNGQPA